VRSIDLTERITEGESRLSSAERRVASAVLDGLPAVAFGTVAGLARSSGTSGATVMRFAEKLGYRGFADLQADVRHELWDSLRPATERIRVRPPHDLLGRALAAELGNVQATLGEVDPAAFETAVRLLVARRARIHVVAGEAAVGIAHVLAEQLAMLRDGVILLGGSPVRVSSQLANAAAGDVAVVIDLRRYDRWLVDAVGVAADAGLTVMTLTDGPLSPFARCATVGFTVTAEGVGPFDSYVGALALVNALVAGVAARLRAGATKRLDRIEAVWQQADALLGE
jgi:DNA-binding MurR/RpiR family transcriptional regulator